LLYRFSAFLPFLLPLPVLSKLFVFQLYLLLTPDLLSNKVNYQQHSYDCKRDNRFHCCRHLSLSQLRLDIPFLVQEPISHERSVRVSGDRSLEVHSSGGDVFGVHSLVFAHHFVKVYSDVAGLNPSYHLVIDDLREFGQVRQVLPISEV